MGVGAHHIGFKGGRAAGNGAYKGAQYIFLGTDPWGGLWRYACAFC